MNYFVIIFFLCTSIQSFGQREGAGVYIPKDDGTPNNRPIKHMWVGKLNPIAPTNGGVELMKVWSDNGVVDSGDFYLSDYSVIPIHPGTVNVFSIQKIWTGKKYDTIQTKNTFKAIKPPIIFIKVTKDNFRKDSTITFALMDSLTSKPLARRYKIGRMYEPKVYDHQGNYVGDVNLCFGKTIDFAGEIHQKLKVKCGYQIEVWITVRDKKTDLLIPAKEYLYTIK